MIRPYRILLVLMACTTGFSAAQTQPFSASEELGKRLFHEERFASPLGDMAVSCATCHPAVDATGYRAFADGLPLSWHPWRYKDPGRFTLRNAPTLLDVGELVSFHFDGEFRSLEEQAERTLLGRNYGWLPAEEVEAIRTIASLVRRPERYGGYRESIRTAHGVAPEHLSDTDLVTLAATSIAAFVRTIRSERNSPYDAFLSENEFEKAPRAGESPAAYGARLLRKLAAQTEDGSLRYVEGFGEAERRGYAIFLRTEGLERAGNCVVCHTPPSFTDGAFHNTGVTQMEYDRQHGPRAFHALTIPMNGPRPHPRYRAAIARMQPAQADLGYWNFARHEDLPGDSSTEPNPEYLQAEIATFKTPTLRNLASTAPYMHDGRYPTLVDALDQKIQAGFLARMRDLRNPDPELSRIRFIVDDISDLFAFLNALNDAGTRTAEFPGLPSNDGTVAPNSSYYTGEE